MQHTVSDKAQNNERKQGINEKSLHNIPYLQIKEFDINWKQKYNRW